MSNYQSHNVDVACDMLIHELRTEIEAINALGAKAFADGRHDDAATALEAARRLNALCDELTGFGERLRAALDDIRQEFSAAEGPPAAATIREPSLPHERAGNTYVVDTAQPTTEPGRSTPRSAFRIPILRSLVALGGRAQGREVLERVYEQVEPLLSEYDRLPLDSGDLRWRKAAHFQRLQMVQEGLLERHSPRGIWEISDEGRAWLARQLSLGENPPRSWPTRAT